jgi:uncharacterized SAM-binding protein YcdF (DUF218 family)
LVLLFVFSNDFLVNRAYQTWELPLKHYNEITLPYDYAIIMGGMSGWNEDYQRLQFIATSDRVAQGIDLYQRGLVKKLIISGGTGSVKYPEDREAPHVKQYLVRWGIPAEDVLIDSTSRNTRENALHVKTLFYQPGKQYLVITSASHMRRTLGCFRGLQMPVTPWPVDSKVTQKGRFKFSSLVLPNPGALLEWHVLLHEWLGFLGYKVAGYY